MNCKVTIPYDLINPLGTPDVQIQWLAMWAVTAWASAQTKNWKTTYSIQVDMLPMQVAQLVVSKWGDVENYPTRVQLDSIDDDCPFLDEDENALTRDDWRTQDVIQWSDGKIYISCSNWQIERPLSQLTSVFDKLVNKQHILSIMSQDE
jgi:hypothetical protein